MLSLLRKLLRVEPPLRMEDPDFGQIRFFPDFGGYWSMEAHWAVPFQRQGLCCVEIPGGRSGPSPQARAFLLEKRAQQEQVWQLCEPFVRQCMSGWDALAGMEPRDAFFITCIIKDSAPADGWEVCFETRQGIKWVYFCLQIEGDEVVSNTVST